MVLRGGVRRRWASGVGGGRWSWAVARRGRGRGRWAWRSFGAGLVVTGPGRLRMWSPARAAEGAFSAGGLLRLGYRAGGCGVVSGGPCDGCKSAAGEAGSGSGAVGTGADRGWPVGVRGFWSGLRRPLRQPRGDASTGRSAVRTTCPGRAGSRPATSRSGGHRRWARWRAVADGREGRVAAPETGACAVTGRRNGSGGPVRSVRVGTGGRILPGRTWVWDGGIERLVVVDAGSRRLRLSARTRRRDQ